MTQAERFFDDVKRQLECSVCQEQFSEINEPKILKCLHTFCKTCLEAWLRKQSEGELSCPTCRHITECPQNDINSLPSHLFCKQLVEIVKAYSGKGQEDSPRCGGCGENKLLRIYCSDCNFFLCEECVESHRKWKNFSGHHIKEIGNFESSDVQDYARRGNYCKKHKDEVRFFCIKCQSCICRDCAILEHQDHNKISLEQGLEKNKREIEAKMRKVEANGSCLKIMKQFLEKRRFEVNNSIEEATSEVKRIAQQRISLIQEHEASVTEQLLEKKASLKDAVLAQMATLDDKEMEIYNTMTFCEDVLLRNNLPEILNVKAMVEQRLQELAVPNVFPFLPEVEYREIKYVPNDDSFLRGAQGKLLTTNTEPSLSVVEGGNLTESLLGDDCTFTVTTKDSMGQTTHSEMDEIEVNITSLSKQTDIKTVITSLKDGRYLISYRPETLGEFKVSITVGGTSIMGSPFELKVVTRESKSKSGDGKPAGSNLSGGNRDNNRGQPLNKGN